MQSKNWKQWIDEFLAGQGDFGARDLNDLGLTPYGDDSAKRQAEIRSLEAKYELPRTHVRGFLGAYSQF